MERLAISVRVRGVTPLICNKFTDAAAEASSSGTRGSSLAADRGTPQEVATGKLYIGLNGAPMIPQPNLLRCLVEGGRFHKAGRTQITTKTTSILYSCIDIAGAEIPIINKQPWKVDTRAVRIPSTGGRILAHRPMFDDWELAFEVELDTRILGIKLFRQIVDDAGSRVGLGDYRPATKGPYGRFNVVSWQEVAADVPMLEAAE